MKGNVSIVPGTWDTTRGTSQPGPGTAVPLGWQCPVDGIVWSPFVQRCLLDHDRPAGDANAPGGPQ